jgi:hypothetical protein
MFTNGIREPALYGKAVKETVVVSQQTPSIEPWEPCGEKFKPRTPR